MMYYVDNLINVWNDYSGDLEVFVVVNLFDQFENDVLEFYVFVFDYFIKDMEYNSVFVSFLIILSVCVDSIWEGYINFILKFFVIMVIFCFCIVKYVVDQ